MLKSMTAYGRASRVTALGRFVVEVQSVNRKHLEIAVLLPKELTRFDADVRKMVGSKVFRGQVTVKISAYFDQSTPSVVMPNLPLARQLKAAWDAIAKDLKLESTEFTLEFLVNEQGVLLYGEELQEEELYRSALSEVLHEALEYFVDMREREGAILQQDISQRLANLKQWVDQIVGRSQGAVGKYRQKLLDRLEEVVPGILENEERILREICIFADRVDITEEITRFHSHLDKCDHLLRSEANGIGKTLEFVLQEMGREVNTIGSKSADVEVSHLVVEMKNDLERIREQLQNIE